MAARVLRYRWEDITGLAELQGPIEVVRTLYRYIAAASFRDPMQSFFDVALLPYFQGKVSVDACVAIYRLSDLIPDTRRDRIIVKETPHFFDAVSVRTSLNDWRTAWESRYNKGAVGVPEIYGVAPEIPGLQDGL